MRRSAWLAMLAWVLQNCHSTVTRSARGEPGGRDVVIAIGSVLRRCASQPCWLAHGLLKTSMAGTEKRSKELPDLPGRRVSLYRSARSRIQDEFISTNENDFYFYIISL
ncbi:hypothetical protein GQ37_018395 [Janthinobacterium sp. BJB1]|uniref:hypothetical protein n=1 Tax=Janthinobacterium sp. GW458P TaxID=1981504 RepID=UPI000C0CFD2C|nr:hypothetical protein [Janthinobacterium sp. GW458P]MBE3028292.1 hypothetical protein [Janthinobacterium sp. GW458P]PHV14565.1 hypothetical protein CSQ90_23290 [Janthinobacterium sp. BJB303]PJC97054.1 hypothetical protein GQ37_018395 [Janthinobacterium sp. BJB1]